MDCYVGWVVSCECSLLFLDITARERCVAFKGSMSSLELIYIVMKQDLPSKILAVLSEIIVMN